MTDMIFSGKTITEMKKTFDAFNISKIDLRRIKERKKRRKRKKRISYHEAIKCSKRKLQKEIVKICI